MSLQHMREQLSATQSSYYQLKHSFENNLHVIQELEEENLVLRQQINTLGNQLNAITQQNLEEMQRRNQQMQKMTLHYQMALQQAKEDNQKEIQEMADLMNEKMRKEIAHLQSKHMGELKTHRNEAEQLQQSHRKVLSDNHKLQEQSKELRKELVAMEQRLADAVEEKNSYASKFASHQTELEGARRSADEFEEMLRSKLKEVQKEKQTIEDELGDIKLTSKQKIRRLKEQQSRKLVQIAEQNQTKLQDVLRQAKEIKHKYDIIVNENKELQRDLASMKEANIRLEAEIQRYREKEMKTNFEKNEKEYNYLLKLIQQEKNYHRSDVEAANEEKKAMRHQIEEAHEKREAAEKGVERLKIELLNQCKLNEELTKELRQLKKGVSGPNNQVYQRKDNIKADEQVSKLFSDDMGSFEGKFFEPNQANTLLAHNGNSDKANPHLMKRIGELQMENQQLKAIVKTMSEEMHNTKKSLEEDRSLKNRELQMSLNEINLLKERINAQKELGFNLKDSNNTLRKELDVLRRELEEAKQEFRERKSVEKEKDRLVKEINMLKEKEANWQVQLHDLQNEVESIRQERDMLEQISSELRAEINQLKESTHFAMDEQSLREQEESHRVIPMQSRIDKKTRPNSYRPLRIEDSAVLGEQIEQATSGKASPESNLCRTIPTNQKGPKKLHDLIRERKQLQISGQKAILQQRRQEIRYDQTGTDSQKQVLDRIKRKTPPKVPNFAQLKRESQRLIGLGNQEPASTNI